MTLIDGDRIVTAQLYDDEHEEFTEKKMSIIDFVNAYTDEGVTTADDVLDNLRAELHATAEFHDDGDCYLRDEWIDEYFDEYMAKVEPQERSEGIKALKDIPSADMFSDLKAEISMYENSEQSIDEMIQGIKSIISIYER